MVPSESYEVTEALLIDAGVTVFQNLFMIAGFLSLLAILPTLLMKPEDAEEENGFIRGCDDLREQGRTSLPSFGHGRRPEDR